MPSYWYFQNIAPLHYCQKPTSFNLLIPFRSSTSILNDFWFYLSSPACLSLSWTRPLSSLTPCLYYHCTCLTLAISCCGHSLILVITYNIPSWNLEIKSSFSDHHILTELTYYITIPTKWFFDSVLLSLFTIF
jgi:hypothetical protein